MSRTIRIATRSSPMALQQAERTATALEKLDPTVGTELIRVTTVGDRWMGDLAKLGGKGAFTKEVDRVLLNDEADLAVHCLKDIPGDVPAPQGLVSAGYLPREDIHDAVISGSGHHLAELPDGSVVGTSSVRRTAQLLLHYPHLRITSLRGNVNSRLQHLKEGHIDALIVAVSGLRRINEAERITEVLSLETMCPPIGAGIIVLQCRVDDAHLLELGAQINDTETSWQALAERTMLKTLQGRCNSPIAGYATLGAPGRLSLRGKVFSSDGIRWLTSYQRGATDDPEALGRCVASHLLHQGARLLLNAVN